MQAILCSYMFSIQGFSRYFTCNRNEITHLPGLNIRIRHGNSPTRSHIHRLLRFGTTGGLGPRVKLVTSYTDSSLLCRPGFRRHDVLMTHPCHLQKTNKSKDKTHKKKDLDLRTLEGDMRYDLPSPVCRALFKSVRLFMCVLSVLSVFNDAWYDSIRGY